MKIRLVSQSCASRFLCPQRIFSSLGYQPPFLFRQGSVQVQHERVRIPAEFSHDKRHPLSHQAKGNVTGKPIELRNDYAAFRTLGGCQGSGQLRASVERIGSFAAFEFNELTADRRGLAAANCRTVARWASIPRPERC